MKLTKKKMVFFLLHVAFSAVVPIVLVILQYSTIGSTPAANGFKVSITGLLFLLLIFWLSKKLFIDSKLADLKIQGNVMLADLKTKQNAAEITALEKEIRYIKTAEAVLNSVVPLLLILAVIVAFKALEAQLIRLSATLGYIAASYFIGIIFNVLHSREVHAKKR